MPAAVCRTSPARSISLWLTIWASAGLSLRTGRNARDQRMAPRCNGSVATGNRASPVTAPTQVGQKAHRAQFTTVTAFVGQPSVRLVRTTGPWLVGSGTRPASGEAGRKRRARGLTSYRHARRPDRWPIRAFAFAATAPLL